MKKLIILIPGLLLAGSVFAGSGHWDGVASADPHHGIKKGSCASKEKMAQFKKFHGEKFSKQDAEQSSKDMVEIKDEDGNKQRIALDRFI
jgi:hypothetical protein